MVMALSIPAFVAEPVEQQPEVMASINGAGETVYIQTFSLDELIGPCATDSSETVTARFHFGVGVEAWREWEQSSRRFQIHDTSGVRLPLAVESSMIITKI